MEITTSLRLLAIGSLIIATNPLFGALKIDVTGGLLVVKGVYVNGHGPYKFLLDTGTNINLIEPELARKVGIEETSPTELSSSAGKTSVLQSDGNEVSIDTVSAKAQRFVVVDIKQIQEHDPEIRGVLGQWFLAGFDYTVDLWRKSLFFGSAEAGGHHVPFTLVNGRMALATNLGGLILDSGSSQLILFGEPERRSGEVRTLAGSKTAGLTPRNLVIDGQTVWHGEALTIRNSTEDGVSGLLPLNIFRKVYVCNTESYLMYE